MRRLMTIAALMLFAAPVIAHADPATERLWKAKCASCHGPDGKGQTPQGKKMATEDMSTEKWQTEFTDDKIKAAIEEGLKRDKNGAKQQMDGYKTKLKPDQITALVAHIRTLKK